MKEKIFKFVKENGFLLFLFLCVGVVAFSTIYVVNKDSNSKGRNLLSQEQMEDIPNQLNEKDVKRNKPNTKKDEIAKETPKKETPPKKENIKESKEEAPKKEVSKKENLDSNKEKKESKPKETESSKEELAQETFSQGNAQKETPQKKSKESHKGFIMPIKGEIMTEFTEDSLIYSETLDEWRAHTGIDIAAETGTKVVAPLDGTVKEIIEDPLWGKVIVLDHGNGLLTKFANLGDTKMVKKGLDVKKGNHIAVVGKTADIEMLMPSHLHFETIKNGKSVDPRSIPQ